LENGGATETTGKRVAWILSVQVSFNFVQVWGRDFSAKSPRTQRREGARGKRGFPSRTGELVPVNYHFKSSSLVIR